MVGGDGRSASDDGVGCDGGGSIVVMVVRMMVGGCGVMVVR